MEALKADDFVVDVVVVIVVGIVNVVDPRNLLLKLGLNQVINRWDVVDFIVVNVVVIVVVVIVVVVNVCCFCSACCYWSD